MKIVKGIIVKGIDTSMLDYLLDRARRHKKYFLINIKMKESIRIHQDNIKFNISLHTRLALNTKSKDLELYNSFNFNRLQTF